MPKMVWTYNKIDRPDLAKIILQGTGWRERTEEKEVDKQHPRVNREVFGCQESGRIEECCAVIYHSAPCDPDRGLGGNK